MIHPHVIPDGLQHMGYGLLSHIGVRTPVESSGKICSIKAKMNSNYEWHTKEILNNAKDCKFFHRQNYINPDGMVDQPKPKKNNSGGPEKMYEGGDRIRISHLQYNALGFSTS